MTVTLTLYHADPNEGVRLLQQLYDNLLRHYHTHNTIAGQRLEHAACRGAGRGHLAEHLTARFRENPWIGIKITGFFDDKSATAPDTLP